MIDAALFYAGVLVGILIGLVIPTTPRSRK